MTRLELIYEFAHWSESYTDVERAILAMSGLSDEVSKEFEEEANRVLHVIQGILNKMRDDILDPDYAGT